MLIELSKEELQQAKDVLLQLSMGKGLVEKRLGICFNLNKSVNTPYIDLGYNIVAELSKGWDKHSGRADYPIMHKGSLPLWENPYRLELCRYLIEQLDECNGKFECNQDD
jgi:hypothetical protein